MDSPRTMALALAALFLAGVAIGAATLLLPHPETSNDSALWSNVALGLLGGIALATTAGRLPTWAIHVVMVIGTVLITRAVYFQADPSAFYSFWYVWVGLYAFFFFGRRGGAAHVGFIAIAYAWVLADRMPSQPLGRWVMVIGTIAIAGVFIDVLAGRVRAGARESESRARALAAITDVAHELARRDSPEAAATAICSAAVDVASASWASLFEPSRDGRGLVITAATLPAMRGTELPFLSRRSGAIRAFTTGERLFIPDAKNSSLVDPGLMRRFPASALLFQPVMRESTSIGVLALNWSEPLAGLDRELAMVVDLLAVEASVAFDRAQTLARLERVARTDDLTGLPNRRAWHEELNRELARATRHGNPLCVGILDLDHFKAYNDRHGHLMGDRFLKQTAAAWTDLIRDTDLLARYGGEEFALALPDTSLEQAKTLLERLRTATPENQRCSAGVVLWDEEEGEAELIARADEALYTAKRAGRDQVVAG